LLKAGKAAVLRRFPFVLILRDARPEAVGEPLRLKLDPGSKTTGLAVVNDARGEVVWAAEVTHRGQRIREALAGQCVEAVGSAKPAIDRKGLPTDAER